MFEVRPYARDCRLGWHLVLAGRSNPGFEVDLDAMRQEPAHENGAGTAVEHGMTLSTGIQW